MLKKMFKSIIDKTGYSIVKTSITDSSYYDMDKDFFKIYSVCKPYTMTSIERMYSLYKSIEYIVQFNIPGDIVECGVWKGGSSMLCAMALLKMGADDKKIYLYDTYEGMSQPTEKDLKAINNGNAKDTWKEKQANDHNEWCYASIDEVKKNLSLTGYDEEKLIFVKGKVENTIPGTAPDKISILRLDTDWYESTYHEMNYLFPRLSKSGVIIIDDYGYWKGAREAIDKYFEEKKITIYLSRIDSTGRLGIKIN